MLKRLFLDQRFASIKDWIDLVLGVLIVVISLVMLLFSFVLSYFQLETPNWWNQFFEVLEIMVSVGVILYAVSVRFFESDTNKSDQLFWVLVAGMLYKLFPRYELVPLLLLGLVIVFNERELVLGLFRRSGTPTSNGPKLGIRRRALKVPDFDEGEPYFEEEDSQ